MVPAAQKSVYADDLCCVIPNIDPSIEPHGAGGGGGGGGGAGGGDGGCADVGD